MLYVERFWANDNKGEAVKSFRRNAIEKVVRPERFKLPTFWFVPAIEILTGMVSATKEPSVLNTHALLFKRLGRLALDPARPRKG